MNEPYLGFDFYACRHMVTHVPRTARRTWKQRLFSWPWRPFRTTNYWVDTVPSEEVLRVGDKFYAHPVVLEMLKLAFEDANNYGAQ